MVTLLEGLFKHRCQTRFLAGSLDQSSRMYEYLRELAEHSRPAAEQELARIAEFAGFALEPWDAPYWLEKYKQKKHSVSNEALRQYFPVATVINEALACGVPVLATSNVGASADLLRDGDVVTVEQPGRRARGHASRHANPVDGHDVPVPHFGVVLTMDEWQALADRHDPARVAAAL